MPLSTLGVIAHLLASFFWGAAAPLVKIALETLPPFTFVFLRMILALIILTPFLLPKIKKHPLKKKDIPMVIVAGFFGISLNIGLYFWGLSKTTVIDSSVILSTTSIFTALAAYFFLKERLGIKAVIGTILSFLGIMVVIGEPLLTSGFFKLDNLIGNIVTFGAMLGWVSYTILNKEISKKYDSLILAYYSFAIGAITFLPFALKDILNPFFYLSLTPFLIFAILVETIFATVASYLLFIWGIKYISATVAGVLGYVNPIVAILISIIFLGEKMTTPFIVGASLVIVGIILVELRTQKSKH